MKWEGIFGMLLLKARVPRGMTSCKIHVVLEFAKANRRDVENYHSSVSKPFADTLVKGGWLVDDTADQFELASMEIATCPPLGMGSPLVKSRVTITIEAEYGGT